MFTVSYQFHGLRFNPAVVNREGAMLADKVGASVTNYTKLALVSFGAIATGGTLRGIVLRSGTNRPVAMFGVAATGLWQRQVVAPKSFHFIVSGRRAGAKMPIRFVGTGKRGGKIFEPLPALVRWFNALSIPQSAWFPILRAISRRGIPPKNVPARAVQQSRPIVQAYAQQAAYNISRGILVRKDAR